MKIIKSLAWVFLAIIGFLIFLDLIDSYWKWIDSWSIQRAIVSSGFVITIAILFKDKFKD